MGVDFEIETETVHALRHLVGKSKKFVELQQPLPFAGLFMLCNGRASSVNAALDSSSSSAGQVWLG